MGGKESGGHLATKMSEHGKKWRFSREKKGPRGLGGKNPPSAGINGDGESRGENGGNLSQTPSTCSLAYVPTKFCMALLKL